MPDTKYYRRKICLIGDAGVGKTSLIKRYVEDKFDDRYIVTLGTKVMMKDVNIKPPDINQPVNVTLMIWDILGQWEFKRLQTSYYRGANGALIVADITRKETLKNTHGWILSMFNNVGKVPLLLLLNKSDLQKQSVVNQEDVEEVIKKWNIPCLTTSAKTGENVEVAFMKISRLIVEGSLKENVGIVEPGPKEAPSYMSRGEGINPLKK